MQDGPVKPEDKRARELDELRQKQLAKSWSGEENAGSQPVPMESFLEKQREQAKFMRLQQKESTENLHKFKSANDVVANALGHSVKDELKKKEQEAAANLHNYRGQPQDFMSHQVKNHLNHNAANKTNLVADVVAPIAGKRLDTVEGKCVSQALKDDGNSSVPSSSDRGRSGSQSTADWSVISGHEFSSDRGLTSTPVNIDMSEISGFLRNGADVAAGTNALSLKSFGGDDTPLSSSYVDASAEMDEKNWKLSFITVAFGLLMHENESPPEGTFTSHIQNDIVNNLMSKMRLITEKSLENQRDVKVAKENEYPLSISIQRDDKYVTPQNRPGVKRNVIKATIPIHTMEGDLQGVSNAKALVYSTLKHSLSDLISKS